jgi:hypothetical protein
MAKMLGAWMFINNPNRTAQEDLNLTVGGVISLNAADVGKLVPGQLFRVRVKVMDDDTFSDDLVFTDESFQLGVNDGSPRPFHTGVIVPRSKLRGKEPSYEHGVEVYCKVSAFLKNNQGRVVIDTGAGTTHTETVKI